MRRKLNLLLIFLFVVLAVAKMSSTIRVVTNLNDAGTGSLRQAIRSASSGDTIRFSPSLISSGNAAIILDSSIIESDKSLVIKGLYNSTDTLFISGGFTNNMFDFNNSISNSFFEIDSLVLVNSLNRCIQWVNYDTLKIRNSVFTNTVPFPSGGGASMINFNRHINVQVSNSLFHNNNSVNYGGGLYVNVYADATIGNSFLKISQSNFFNNRSVNEGGALRVKLNLQGTAAHCEFETKIDTCNFQSNQSGSGGSAIDISTFGSGNLSANAKLSLTFCNVSNNTATNQTVGNTIFIQSDSTSHINLYKTTINDNNGGAIYNQNLNLNNQGISYFTIDKSTLYNSSGGGLASNCKTNIAVIRNSTIVNNPIPYSTSFPGGIRLYYSSSSSTQALNTIQLTNNIILSNGNSANQGNIYLPNSNDSIQSGGYNIFGDNPLGYHPQLDYINIQSSDVALGSLAFNNNLTRTMIPHVLGRAFNRGHIADTSDAQNSIIYERREIGAAENCGSLTYDSIVSCNDYVFGSLVLTQTGSYQQTFQNIRGCDSFVFLEYTDLRGYSSLNIDACDSLIYNGIRYDTSISLVDTLLGQAASGCDSIVYTHIYVGKSYTRIDTLIGCDSLSFSGKTYYASDSLIDIFSTSTLPSCDSIVRTYIVIGHTAHTYHTIKDCDSIIYNGDTFYTSTIVHDTFIRPMNCDSIVTLVLTISPVIRDTLYRSICHGDSIFFKGLYRRIPAIYHDTLKTAKDCDSISTLVLSHKIARETATYRICIGDSFYYRGKYYKTAQTFIDTTYTAGYCMKIITKVYTIATTPIYRHIYDAICQGGHVLFYGQTLTKEGSYTKPLSGCDTAVVLHLKVHPKYRDTISVCKYQGDGVNFNTIYRTATGVYTHTTTSQYGCDSISILRLTINPKRNLSITSQSPMLLATKGFLGYRWYRAGTLISISDTAYLFASGVYTVRVTDSNGCSMTSDYSHKSSIEQSTIPPTISIYPNPAHDIVYIKAEQEVHVELYNMLGQKIISKSIAREGEILLHDMAEGIYYCRIYDSKHDLIQSSKLEIRKE